VDFWKKSKKGRWVAGVPPTREAKIAQGWGNPVELERLAYQVEFFEIGGKRSGVLTQGRKLDAWRFRGFAAAGDLKE